MSATITGIGLLTPVERGAGPVFDAVCAGKSGLSAPPPGHPTEGALEVGGFLPAYDPGTVATGPDAHLLDRVLVLALLAARDAIADAGLEVGRDVDPERVAVVVGGIGGMATLEAQAIGRAERGRVAVSPYLLPAILPNMAAARIAIAHGIRGHSATIATACAAGAQALAEGQRLIDEGDADVVVCGASEAPLFGTFADAFGNARALARGWADPTAASRPFDRRRNGFVLAEGAGMLVLERTAHAEGRRAAGYADLAGWGVTTDAHHPTAPRPDGASAATCMRRALARGGIAPGDVDYVNAHGTGTKLGDVAEVVALRAVFGAEPPAVSSTKGVTGHMLGTSGVVEAAVSALAVRLGVLPPTHNLDDPDPACDLPHVRGSARVSPVGYALSNSFGFGGQNTSLLFGRAGTTRERTPATA